jgi:hypothetical protein
MGALKALGVLAGFILAYNLVALFLEVVFFVLGGYLATGLFFGLMFWGLYKLAILWLNEGSN